MEREHTKQVLKARSCSNYFTHYSSTDTQGSQECIQNISFTHRQLDMVEIKNDCTCVT